MNFTVFLEFPTDIFDMIRKIITHRVKGLFKSFKGFIVALLGGLITVGVDSKNEFRGYSYTVPPACCVPCRSKAVKT